MLADSGISGLRAFRQNRLYRAGKGENGKGQKKHGKRGEDLVLRVPVGTMITDNAGESGALIADCVQSGKKEVVAAGGRGGLGNVHFASSTNQTPRIAQKGEPGDELSLTLELRLIADIGIIGFPNAGKSTLLAAASAATPRIADYPFTTLEPVLGAVEAGPDSYILAEIPGLIEGAHLGKGLGHDFLRHIMRTKILVHLIDGTSESPVEDMLRVSTELSLFDTTLAQKPQVVAVNKIDLPAVSARIEEIRKTFNDAGIPVLFISAIEGEGIAGLVAEAVKVLKKTEAAAEADKQAPRVVFRPQPRGAGVSVHKEDNIFIVTAPELERIIARVDLANPEVRRQLLRPMEKQGVSRALEKAGIKPGDKVRCGEFEWEW